MVIDMEEDKILRVYRYLNIPAAGKETEGKYILLLTFGFFACIFNSTKIRLEDSIPCIIIITIGIFIWSRRIKKDNKLLFFFEGVYSSLVCLYLLLIALGAFQVDLMRGFIIFSVILLFSVPIGIYRIKSGVTKSLREQGRTDTDITSNFKIVSVISALLGIALARSLTPHIANLLFIISIFILFYIFQQYAIQNFYKAVIRRKYHIDEWIKQGKFKIKEAVVPSELDEIFDLEIEDQEFMKESDMSKVMYTPNKWSKKMITLLCLAGLAIYLMVFNIPIWEYHSQQIAICTKMITADPNAAQVYSDRGIAYFNEGTDAMSADDFRDAPSVISYIYSILGGEREYVSKQYDLGIADFSKAIEIDPTFVEAYCNRGKLYYLQGGYDLAVTDASKAIELDPTVSKAYFIRGEAYNAKHLFNHRLGNFDDRAIADYEKGIELEPNNESAHYFLIYLYEQKRQDAKQKLL